MTSTDDSTMQAICARSLGEVGNPATAPLLVTLLGDPQHTVASSAATALVALGDAGIAALQALVDEHGPGAAYARQALAVTWLRSGIAQDVLRA
jgi:HEAT repeat protein